MDTGQTDKARPAPRVLWTPSHERIENANVTRFLKWLRGSRRLAFRSYHELWQWSVSDLEAFWSSVWDYFELGGDRKDSTVLADRTMPAARWFPGATLNYAERALQRRDDHIAVSFRSETGARSLMTYSDLAQQVGTATSAFRSLGIGRGDRVAAFVPNIPEAVVAFLACASIGAIWSSCAPEFGVESVIDRFAQIQPRVLLATEAYSYGGKVHDRRGVVERVRAGLPSVEHTVLIRYPGSESSPSGAAGTIEWSSLLESPADPRFEEVPFDHPLWVLYSSGTTGPPKAIVQGHGGILLEHLKALSLHLDLKESDRFFWFTTTGWMMWNLLLGGLLLGCTVVLYDGSPRFPDLGALWRIAEEAGVTYFGTSAPFIQACIDEGIKPGREFDLAALHSLGSTASPLPPRAFEWVYRSVGSDLLLGSISGGTDVCTSLVISSPLLPVYSGELQCRALGAKVESFDDSGRSIIGRVGELVVTEPMPSMPLFFWNDPDGSRYRSSYFDVFPGVWRHGDWITITDRHTCVISGRSDATLNRGGVRMGTAEFYGVVDAIAGVDDSLVVEVGSLEVTQLLLFVVPRSGDVALERLAASIAETIRRELSPRHVPDRIMWIWDVPRTLNGKKLEVPIKRLLSGVPPERALNLGAVGNPESLEFFLRLAQELGSGLA